MIVATNTGHMLIGFRQGTSRPIAVRVSSPLLLLTTLGGLALGPAVGLLLVRRR